MLLLKAEKDTAYSRGLFYKKIALAEPIKVNKNQNIKTKILNRLSKISGEGNKIEK